MPCRPMSRALAVLMLLVAGGATAQIHRVSDALRRAALDKESHIERMVRVPMRDGVRLASRVYLPRAGTGPFPTILWRSPYNFSEKMKPNPDYADANLKFALDAIRHGYAFVMQNERGKFFSEGEFEVLGRPRTDGHDTLTWIAAQDWSNGKVGTIGCSSTAEWIMGLASLKHPAHVAAVPMGQGAGIGRMGPHYEQGNFYKGGVIQLPMLTWLYYEQNRIRPTFPPELSRDALIRAAQYYDLAPQYPEPDWRKAFWHLPLADALVAAGGPNGIFDEMVDRNPDHPDWYRGGLYHDSEDFTVPALWVNSWFDLSVAPTEHCHMYRLRDPHVVGERNMGTVNFGLDEIVYEFFDFYMKGKPNGFPQKRPPVQYFSMGTNRWRTAAQWPPAEAQQLTLYLSSERGANTLHGDGKLTVDPAAGFGP